MGITASGAMKVGVLAIATVLHAGCANDADPDAAERIVDSVGSSPSDAGVVDTARPVDLPLDEVDPCDLLVDSVVESFALRGSPIPQEYGDNQRGCQMLTGPPGGYIVGAATKEGMERFEGIPEEMAVVRELEIAGFGAAELQDANQPTACLIGVDVADGQHLAVYATDVPDGGTTDETCATAADFAEAVMEVLPLLSRG